MSEELPSEIAEDDPDAVADTRVFDGPRSRKCIIMMPQRLNVVEPRTARPHNVRSHGK